MAEERRTEIEKMLAGELYSSEGDNLPDMHINCLRMCQKYNNADPGDAEELHRILCIKEDSENRSYDLYNGNRAGYYTVSAKKIVDCYNKFGGDLDAMQ